MTSRVWTREDLDRDHPLPDGWSWGFQFVDDSDELDPTRPWAFGQAPSGHDCCVELIEGKLRAYDITGTHLDPPADVALAVILASKGLDSREAMAAAMDSMASKAGRRSLLAGGWEDPEPGEEHVNEDSEAESLYAGMADGFVAAAKMLRRGTVQP